MNELSSFNHPTDVTPKAAAVFIKAVGGEAGKKPRAATRGGRMFYAVTDLVPDALKKDHKGHPSMPWHFGYWLRNNCSGQSLTKISISRASEVNQPARHLLCIREDAMPTLLVYLNHKIKGRNFSERWSSLPDSYEVAA